MNVHGHCIKSRTHRFSLKMQLLRSSSSKKLANGINEKIGIMFKTLKNLPDNKLSDRKNTGASRITISPPSKSDCRYELHTILSLLVIPLEITFAASEKKTRRVAFISQFTDRKEHHNDPSKAPCKV